MYHATKMDQRLITAVIFILVPVFISGTPFKDCGPGNIKSVTIEDNGKVCDASPCQLKKGLNASITVVFTAKEDSTKSTSKAAGIVAGVPVPYPLDDSDGCKGMSPACPIKNGQQYTYKTNFFVKPVFPSVKLVVKWEEIADSGKPLLCLEFGASIV